MNPLLSWTLSFFAAVAPSQAPPQAPPQNRAALPLSREAVVQRDLIAEMIAAAEGLQFEVVRYRGDAETIWRVWTSNLGVRGGGLDWLQFRDRVGTGDEARGDALQAELFRLDTRAVQLAEDVDGLLKALDDCEKNWEEARGLLLTGGAGAATLLAQSRERLEALAVRLNALDQDIQDGQTAYDRSRPRADRFLRRHVPAAALAPTPWHWRYAASGKPRLLLRYDFARRYAETLERARREAGR